MKDMVTTPFTLHQMHQVLRMASHELLTPVSALKGITYLMKNELTPELSADKEYLNMLEQAAERLHRLVNRVLLFESIDANITVKRTDEYTPINVLLKQLIQKHSSMQDRESDTTYFTPVNDEVTVAVPKEHLLVIIEELVTNVYSFSRKGSTVFFSLFLNKTKSEVVLTFEDSGIGMTNEEIQQIEAYTQFNRIKYEQQGVGLGLFLVKYLVNMYDGTTHIASSPGKGTTVYITLPVKY
jgi:signal transduction histidine kinase